MNIELAEKDKELERILENIPAELDLAVTLPSRNRFYNLKDKNKPITVRSMKFEDERMFADTSRKGADSLNILLDRCVSNIDIDDLLLIDKLILLIKIREATYGKDYEFDLTCTSCGAEERVGFDLNDLSVNELPSDFQDPFSISLPVLKKEIKIKLPRVKDEQYVLTATNKNLWRFITDIDGCSDRGVISEVVKKLPLQDVHCIIKKLSGDEFGLEPKMNFSCPHCGHSEEIVLPISSDFFYMS
tara:strand:+ start:1550 stop:2284 length:735 start_codon:yes stop_codon:yes gene_type:complete